MGTAYVMSRAAYVARTGPWRRTNAGGNHDLAECVVDAIVAASSCQSACILAVTVAWWCVLLLLMLRRSAAKALAYWR